MHFICESLFSDETEHLSLPCMREVVSVLCDDVLLEGVALGETLVAVVANEVTALLVYRLHVLLQTRSLSIKHNNNLMAIP